MTVDYYIRQLLYRNDCVVIPEFGAFLVKRVSAKVNVEDNQIVPPKRVLSFNPLLKNDDGLLISYVSEAHKISYTKAQQLVNDFVVELNSAINRKKEVLVEDLGKFSYNENNFLSFEAVVTKNYLLSSFGLETTSLTNVNLVANETAEVQDKTNVIPISADQTAHTNNLRWAKYAAAFVGLVLATGVLGWQYQENKYIHQEQLVIQRLEEKVENHLQKANFSISPFTSVVEVELPKEELFYPFHIIGGAFRSQTNALKKVNQLKELGYQAKEIGQNKYGLYQVVYQSFLTREDAILALTKIRQNHNQNAWLLVQ